jgi:hypothetical protein
MNLEEEKNMDNLVEELTQEENDNVQNENRVNSASGRAIKVYDR